MKKNTVLIGVILVAIVLDTMGVGLIFPLMPDLFLSSHSLLLSATATHSWRTFFYGLSFSLWALGIFFGAPFLGELSDRFGRKIILSGALGLVACSYMISYLSLLAGSLTLFLLSRLLNGFFSSTFSLAQAIIVDISPEPLRARNLGWVVLAASIGFVFGPVLSAAAYHFAGATHGADWTFASAALLALINTLLIVFLMKESVASRSTRAVHLFSVLTTCRFVFADRRVVFLTLVFFLLQLGWGGYVQSIPVVLSQNFGQTPIQVSAFYALIGAGFLTMTLWVQPFLLRRFALKTLTMAGFIGMMLALTVALFVRYWIWEWGAGFLVAISDCLVYTTLMALFSNAVNADEQGRVMGGAGAIFGLTWGVLALFLGVLIARSPMLPVALAAFATFIAAMLMGMRK